MLRFQGWRRLILFFWALKTLLVTGTDWYSFYVQCVATSSQESQCFESIQDFLATEEGKRQALEIGFKRRVYQDSNQVVSQAVVISNRIGQMESYLSGALDKAKEEQDTVRAYCLGDKHQQISFLKRNVDERKTHLLRRINQISSGVLEGDYQIILASNSRANQVYLQARKCLE